MTFPNGNSTEASTFDLLCIFSVLQLTSRKDLGIFGKLYHPNGLTVLLISRVGTCIGARNTQFTTDNYFTRVSAGSTLFWYQLCE